MQVVDLFCGVGGFSAGVLETGSPVLGVDNDDLMVRLWAANTKGTGKLADLWQEVALIGCDGPSLSHAISSSYSVVHQPLHIHISPPCTTLSKARRNTERAGENAASGMAYLRESLDFLRGMDAKSWSIETVSTPLVQECLREYQEDHDDFKFAWTVVDAADYNSPSTRIRIIAGNPGMIRELRQIPVSRVSVVDAFRRAGIEPAAEYIKNNTKTRKKQPCIRPNSTQCHTQTASHPLIWCTAEGVTVRCLNVRETAIIMGFPEHWLLPKSSRAAIKALGNAVPPSLSHAIMRAAKTCADNTES